MREETARAAARGDTVKQLTILGDLPRRGRSRGRPEEWKR